MSHFLALEVIIKLKIDDWAYIYNELKLCGEDLLPKLFELLRQSQSFSPDLSFGGRGFY